MCFCLLPVTGSNLNFVFPGELVDWRILDSFVIFSKVSLRKEDLDSELGSIQQIWTIFKSCHCDFWHFHQIFQNCLNLLNVCGGLWSLIKLFVWFLKYFPELWLGVYLLQVNLALPFDL